MNARFQRTTPFLCFDDQVEQAATFYAAVFENSRITAVTRYREESAQALDDG